MKNYPAGKKIKKLVCKIKRGFSTVGVLIGSELNDDDGVRQNCTCDLKIQKKITQF